MKKLCLIVSFTTLYNYAMETIPSLPDDIVELVMQYSLPKLNLYYQNINKPGRWYHTEKGTFPDNSAIKDQKDTNDAIQKLQQIISAINTYRLTNKHWKNCITKNVASWLEINKENANALLIRATQGHIPYFIKLAVAHKADLNFIHKPDGYTPLLHATKNKQYNTCKFLLEKGASVNIKREVPYAAYTYDSSEWPIHIAIKNNDLELVKLFIQHHAQLDFHFFLTTPLLALAAKQNNPYILAALLEARPHRDSFNYWSCDEMEHALETIQRLEVKTDKEKLEKRTCINILETALENSSKSFKETMNLFFFDFTKKI